MEVSQGNSTTFISKKQKCHIFLFLFLFSLLQIREQEGRTTPAQGGGLTPVGGRRWWGKGIGE
jgi:hypothetical protein